jgi:hypothetical protein
MARAMLSDTTLYDLAQKLVELRQHLEQVRTDLSRATSGGHVGLRCHTCCRERSTDEAGWTLHLCGDDELHPFCPDCDRRHVNGNGRNGSTPVENGRDGAGG